MKQYNPALPVISVHIPKCGGISFKTILHKWFGDGLLEHLEESIENPVPPKHELPSGSVLDDYPDGLCIHGHFHNDRQWGVEDYYPGMTQQITFVRDPWEIVKSMYFYRKHQKAIGSPTEAWDGNAFHEAYPDLQAWLSVQHQSHIPNYLPRALNLDNYKDLLEEHFLFMATLEDFQLGVNVLGRILDKPTILTPIENAAPRRESIDNEDMLKARFIDNNPLAYAIWDFARHWMITASQG